jgi:hypothetical protein
MPALQNLYDWRSNAHDENETSCSTETVSLIILFIDSIYVHYAVLGGTMLMFLVSHTFEEVT